jgi:hypothetical protein
VAREESLPRRGSFGKSLIDNPAHLARICATSAKAIEQLLSPGSPSFAAAHGVPVYPESVKY